MITLEPVTKSYSTEVKTDREFGDPPGLTALIGPNGAGSRPC